jgi:hypothetical protein
MAAVVALMAVRPGTEFQLFQQLYGNPQRWVMSDGGASGIFVSSGQACISLVTAASPLIPGQTLMFVAETPSNVCVQKAQLGLPWDGGCNTTDTDVNFGVPIQPWVPQYIGPDNNATSICAASDGGSVRIPIWRMQ